MRDFMDRKYSIKKKEEIDQIFSAKNSYGNKEFALYIKTHEYSHFRFALSIGKKFGIAVARNKAKRQVRAILTNLKDQIIQSKSFVIVIKPRVNELSFKDINESLLKLINKAKLIIEED